jgi:hypothetical protein
MSASRIPLLALAILLVFPGSADAKSQGRITGKVSSSAGEALLGAIITVLRQSDDGGTISFTRSDKHGLYNLSNIAPGSYYLQVSRDGYQPLTSSNVQIAAGRTTTLNVVLQDFLQAVSGDIDEQNWPAKTLLRSTSDRRLIFRDLPGTFATEKAFSRSGVMTVVSNTAMGSGNYSVYPSSGQNTLVSNFAFAEPVSDNARVVLAGQFNSGYDSFWKIKNTYHYRPDFGQEMALSVGYGRMSLNGNGAGLISRPSQFFTQDDLYARESGVETLTLGVGSSSRLIDGLSFDYGFDISRLSYGITRNVFSPYLHVVFSPADKWVLKTSLASKREVLSEELALPDGEMISLAEPAFLAKINGEVSSSQFKHSELSIGRSFADDATLEVGVYEDHMVGRGLPFLVRASAGGLQQDSVAQLRQNQLAQHGMRVGINGRLLDILTGSIIYAYGTATSMSGAQESISAEQVAKNLLDYMERSYQHSLTSEINAVLPRTGTNVMALVRWHPGNPITPIDPFSDRLDVTGKGVNFSLRQPIPLPEFMGSSSRWEALIDVRNLLDQGIDVVRTSDGELRLCRSPRSLRFGLNLNLY